jgi:hypothetical protein
MRYKIKPDIRYRSESYGGVVEGWKSGTVFMNKSEYATFLSFESPREWNGQDNKEVIEEMISLELISEVKSESR